MSRPTKRQRRFELTLDHDLLEWFEADAKKRSETVAMTVRRILVEYQAAALEFQETLKLHEELRASGAAVTHPDDAERLARSIAANKREA